MMVYLGVKWIFIQSSIWFCQIFSAASPASGTLTELMDRSKKKQRMVSEEEIVPSAESPKRETLRGMKISLRLTISFRAGITTISYLETPSKH
jgi:hypothetical protein